MGTDDTLTVSQLLGAVEVAITTALPEPVWVRGEVTGFKRTSGGAAFFRLVDPDVDEAALEVAARGRVMTDIDNALLHAGLGRLQEGIEVRIRGTLGVSRRQSLLRLSLLEVDPAFTAGRLAIDREAVLKRLSADGTLAANGRLDLPLVPLRVGLVTSRGSAAHADFIHQLRSSGFRFSVKTAHTQVQGETAVQSVTAAIGRAGREQIDILALVRGGGAKLDLAVFDTEEIGRAIATSPVPVITGIGHETDRTVADEAAAVAQKTPTAAAEWLVGRVADFSDRVESARGHIRGEARAALARARQSLREHAASLTAARGALSRQHDLLDHQRDGIGNTARAILARERSSLDSWDQIFAAMGIDQTLRRGFAVVTTEADGRVVRWASQVSPGDRLRLRLSDGTVPVTVEET